MYKIICCVYIVPLIDCFQIVFEYLPSSLETIESLWCFSIPSISLSHSFLLVGHTDEPSVNLDRAYVSFKAMLIGTAIICIYVSRALNQMCLHSCMLTVIQMNLCVCVCVCVCVRACVCVCACVHVYVCDTMQCMISITLYLTVCVLRIHVSDTKSLLSSGTKVKETVYLINNEPTAYRFSIVEKSCHCDGHAGQLVVEPMSGTIQPNTRYLIIEIQKYQPCSFTL